MGQLGGLRKKLALGSNLLALKATMATKDIARNIANERVSENSQASAEIAREIGGVDQSAGHMTEGSEQIAEHLKTRNNGSELDSVRQTMCEAGKALNVEESLRLLAHSVGSQP